MGLDAITVDALLKADAAPGMSAGSFVEAALGWLPAFFAPREGLGSLDGARLERRLLSGVHRGAAELWSGESVSAELPLTTLVPESAALEGIHAERSCELVLFGGLRHRLPVGDAPEGWFGRVVFDAPGSGLGRLVTVRVDWNELARGVSVSFHFAGYPLTRQLPVLDESLRVTCTDRLELVGHNRRSLREAFGRLPAALGVAPGELEFRIDAQRAILDADRRELAEWEAELGSAAP